MLSNFHEFATNTSKLFTGGEGGVLPTMDYKGRLCLKGVPFSGRIKVYEKVLDFYCRYVKGVPFSNEENERSSILQGRC